MAYIVILLLVCNPAKATEHNFPLPQREASFVLFLSLAKSKPPDWRSSPPFLYVTEVKLQSLGIKLSCILKVASILLLIRNFKKRLRYIALFCTVTYVETHCIVLLKSFNIPKIKKYVMPKNYQRKPHFCVFQKMALNFKYFSYC